MPSCAAILPMLLAVVATAGEATYATAVQFTPTYRLDAEAGTLGLQYEGVDGWSDSDGATTVSSTHAFDGTKSFRCHADQGTAANEGLFGSWGGRKGIAPVTRGGTLQVQYSYFLPTGFDWTANPWLKFIRFHVATSAGSNVGYEDIYIHNDGTLAHHSEIAGTVHRIEGELVHTGVWETIEMAVTFDTVAADAGGQGRVRIWRYRSGTGMALVYENTAERTMAATSDRSDGVFLFTYWNSRADKDGLYYPLSAQDCWVDRLIIETDPAKLVESDAGGRKIIGGVATSIAVNHQPVAQGQSVAVRQDVAVAITMIATDADGDPLTYAIVGAPAHGALSGSGAVRTYTPDAGYAGGDRFTFVANDGTLDSLPASVAISVAGVGTGPPPGSSGSGGATGSGTGDAGACGAGAVAAVLAGLALALSLRPDPAGRNHGDRFSRCAPPVARPPGSGR